MNATAGLSFVKGIEDVSPLTERRSAGAAFMDNMERLEIENETQRETINGLTMQLADQANRLDILNRTLKEAEATRDKYLRYATTLGEQVRSNVASNVRALEIANECFTDLAKREQTDKQAADVEKLLARNDGKWGDTYSGKEPPVAMPAEREDMTDATRSLLGVPLYIDDEGRKVGFHPG